MDKSSQTDFSLLIEFLKEEIADDPDKEILEKFFDRFDEKYPYREEASFKNGSSKKNSSSNYSTGSIINAESIVKKRGKRRETNQSDNSNISKNTLISKDSGSNTEIIDSSKKIIKMNVENPQADNEYEARRSVDTYKDINQAKDEGEDINDSGWILNDYTENLDKKNCRDSTQLKSALKNAESNKSITTDKQNSQNKKEAMEIGVRISCNVEDSTKFDMKYNHEDNSNNNDLGNKQFQD